MVKVLLLGSNISSASPTMIAFHIDTKSRKTLDRWLSGIDCIPIFGNIIDHPTKNNRPLLISEIRSAIPSIKEKTLGYNKIVALGVSASKALEIAGIAHFKMFHPSGLNRKLNSPEQVELKVLELTEYIIS